MFTGTATHPAAIAPKYATTNSGTFWRRRPTRSPGATGRDRRKAANRRQRSSSAAYDHGSPASVTTAVFRRSSAPGGTECRRSRGTSTALPSVPGGPARGRTGLPGVSSRRGSRSAPGRGERYAPEAHQPAEPRHPLLQGVDAEPHGPEPLRVGREEEVLRRRGTVLHPNPCSSRRRSPQTRIAAGASGTIFACGWNDGTSRRVARSVRTTNCQDCRFFEEGALMAAASSSSINAPGRIARVPADAPAGQDRLHRLHARSFAVHQIVHPPST